MFCVMADEHPSAMTNGSDYGGDDFRIPCQQNVPYLLSAPFRKNIMMISVLSFEYKGLKSCTGESLSECNHSSAWKVSE